MHIEKTILGKLPRVYSLAAAPGGRGFLAGSETEGPLLYWPRIDAAPRTLARAPGGFISLWCFEMEGRPFVVVANNFKPGFDAADCHIVVYPLDAGEEPEAVADFALPYTHRVAVVELGGRLCFLGSTLCESKAHTQDWSRPGGIHLAEITRDPAQAWPLRQIVGGLTKNHGMELGRIAESGPGGMLLSAEEGLAFLEFPESPDAEWPLHWISRRATSDAFSACLGPGGEACIFTLSPFHGNELGLYRRDGEAWRYTVLDDTLEMGHVVWAGSVLGEPGLIVADRRGRRALRLYRPTSAGAESFEGSILDEDIGPSQLLVFDEGPDHTRLVVAGHNHDVVLQYDLTR